jgi:aspartyl-tRNA synthetase
LNACLGHEVRKKDAFNLLWVHDFPLFAEKEDGSEGNLNLRHLVNLN